MYENECINWIKSVINAVLKTDSCPHEWKYCPKDSDGYRVRSQICIKCGKGRNVTLPDVW